MAHPKRIALAFPTFASHGTRITAGILDYRRQHTDWQFAFSPELLPVTLASLQGWPGHGIIGNISTPADVALLKKMKLPTVNISTSFHTPGIPTVANDDRAVGRSAAEHLLARGFRRFAFFGQDQSWYSNERYQGFAAVVTAAGYPCDLCIAIPSPVEKPWQWDRPQLVSWLKQLKPPVGIFTSHDYRARMILETCPALHLKVPGDVAVIGVNNDTITCEHCQPPLTSVPLDGHRIGYEAARLLHTLLSGEKLARRRITVAPLPIVERDSTDTVATDDQSLRQAINLIHARYDKALSIEQIADEVGVSRRWLENLFQAQLALTPADYLARLRVTRATEMLTQSPKAKLNDIAQRNGFTSSRHMKKTFERITGHPPKATRPKPAATRQHETKELGNEFHRAG